MHNILLITASENIKNYFFSNFVERHSIICLKALEEVERASNDEEGFDYLFIDYSLFHDSEDVSSRSDTSVVEIVERFDKLFPRAIKIFLVSDKSHVGSAFARIKQDYQIISYPAEAQKINEIFNTDSLLGYERCLKDPKQNYSLESKSSAMKAIYKQIKQIADTKTNVLILGESGTGKSLIAKTICSLSSRRDNRFIHVNCGSIPEALFESEFFGHEKGAFTGAVKTKIGKFELADKGTIFLDEIGTISPSSQVSLLHVLQDETFHRVGGEKEIKVDVRVIAATNTNLEEAISDNTFRKDLYFRLNVFPIEVPSLKNRTEDIVDLSTEILGKLNEKHKKGIKKIDPDTVPILLNYSWPGNIRELENILERAYVLEKSDTLGKENFLFFLETSEINSPVEYGKADFETLNLSQARRLVLDEFEKRYIRELLERTYGDLKLASKLSGVSVRQLHKFISKHNVDRRIFMKNFVEFDQKVQ